MMRWSLGGGCRKLSRLVDINGNLHGRHPGGARGVAFGVGLSGGHFALNTGNVFACLKPCRVASHGGEGGRMGV